MSEATVEPLIDASAALIAALDAHDIEAIEAAIPAIREAVRAVKAQRGWQDSPEFLGRLKHALGLTSAARARIRFLADHNRRRIDIFTRAAGLFDMTPIAYGPPR